jgi:cytochrome c oxidase subunit 2
MLLSNGFCGISGAAEHFDYCILCHGANGNGNAAIQAPRIAGLEPWYVRRQLEAFAAGIRGTHPSDASGLEMAPVGVRLKQEQMFDAAVKFIGSLRPSKPPATVIGDAEKGRQVYAACSACHGAKGEGNSVLQAPALAARTDWYLVRQLNNYRHGLRGAHPQDTYGAQMRAVAATLPDEQAVTDVVAFINTLN